MALSFSNLGSIHLLAQPSDHVPWVYSLDVKAYPMLNCSYSCVNWLSLGSHCSTFKDRSINGMCLSCSNGARASVMVLVISWSCEAIGLSDCVDSF